jgi:hypothetical protein
MLFPFEFGLIAGHARRGPSIMMSRYSAPKSSAAVWIAQGCNGSGGDKLAIACQCSVFRCHRNEATKLASVWLRSNWRPDE